MRPHPQLCAHHDGADGDVLRVQLRAEPLSGNLAEAKAQNISILSYLANHFNAPLIAWMAPIIAMIAITKSFLGHYLGAREGFNGMVIKSLRGKGKTIEITKLNKITALFMLVTTWIVATLNPSHSGG
ncbi:Serine transporter [Raoultella terrigena]|uniref:Serine transporter n=1 Tax=Raoultella terrigena TaxID=577 RepID=A0A3P8M302_RAOTE|nr:Serine transporter [Raoultella terrigena]